MNSNYEDEFDEFMGSIPNNLESLQSAFEGNEDLANAVLTGPLPDNSEDVLRAFKELEGKPGPSAPWDAPSIKKKKDPSRPRISKPKPVIKAASTGYSATSEDPLKSGHDDSFKEGYLNALKQQITKLSNTSFSQKDLEGVCNWLISGLHDKGVSQAYQVFEGQWTTFGNKEKLTMIRNVAYSDCKSPYEAFYYLTGMIEGVSIVKLKETQKELEFASNKIDVALKEIMVTKSDFDSMLKTYQAGAETMKQNLDLLANLVSSAKNPVPVPPQVEEKKTIDPEQNPIWIVWDNYLLATNKEGKLNVALTNSKINDPILKTFIERMQSWSPKALQGFPHHVRIQDLLICLKSNKIPDHSGAAEIYHIVDDHLKRMRSLYPEEESESEDDTSE